MDYFSALGRSLMMPIAALAAFGIILGLTSALLKPEALQTITLLQNPFIFYVITLFNKLAGVVFTLIPVLFAISIALGLAKTDKEIAAFAGFIGYYAFLVSSSVAVSSNLISLETLRVTSILGVETIDMGAVAGMLTGMIVAALHNKFHDVTFPVAIAFYGGEKICCNYSFNSDGINRTSCSFYMGSSIWWDQCPWNFDYEYRNYWCILLWLFREIIDSNWITPCSKRFI